MASMGSSTPSPHLPEPARSHEQRYLDAQWRAAANRHRMAHTCFCGDTLPIASTDIGPGSLATMLGSEPGLAEDTIWFNPCIDDPELDEPITFSPDTPWWRVHRAILEANVAASEGHYMVGCPDLVENIDILASLRGGQPLLFDMIERPAWVHRRLAEINQAFFAVYGRIYDLIKRPNGAAAYGAFHLYGDGAPPRCNATPRPCFRPICLPSSSSPIWMSNAGGWTMPCSNLDGTGCICQLDHLLALESLDAIEWTPESGREPNGSHEKWWPMYRRILEAGKSVQVVGAKKAEVIPMLEALGSKGPLYHGRGFRQSC